MSKRNTRKRPRQLAPAPPNTTLGRPKESGSRQQAHPDQGSQSGSHELDSRAAHRRMPMAPLKPSGAKYCAGGSILMPIRCASFAILARPASTAARRSR